MSRVKNFPEYLLMLSVLFYWVSSAVIVNPIAIALVLCLILQLLFQNKVVGISIGAIFICSSLFMLLALMSEFSEFPVFNAEAQKLLFVGLTYFISTIIIAGIMIYKYAVANNTERNYSTI